MVKGGLPEVKRRLHSVRCRSLTETVCRIIAPLEAADWNKDVNAQAPGEAAAVGAEEQAGDTQEVAHQS